MVKTKIIETTEKYDKDGKLVEKITREETSEDDEKGVWRATPPWATEPLNILSKYHPMLWKKNRNN